MGTDGMLSSGTNLLPFSFRELDRNAIFVSEWFRSDIRGPSAEHIAVAFRVAISSQIQLKL